MRYIILLCVVLCGCEFKFEYKSRPKLQVEGEVDNLKVEKLR